MPNREDNTIICRCEDLTLGDLRRLVAQGYRTLDELKRIGRFGMGPCQGRTCRLLVAQELERLTGVPVAEQLVATYRPPTKPIKLKALAAMKREAENHA